MPRHAQSQPSDNTRVAPVRVVAQTAIRRKQVTQAANQDYERLKKKYPNLANESYTYLVKFDRQHEANLAKQKSYSISQDNRNEQQKRNAGLAASDKQKEADEAQAYNTILRVFGASDMSTEEARANPQAVAEKMDEVKNDIANAALVLYPAARGMSWLRGTGRLGNALYHGINGTLAAASGYDMYENGPGFWNTLGIVAPALEYGPQASKAIQDQMLRSAMLRAANKYKFNNGSATSEVIPQHLRLWSEPTQKYIIDGTNTNLAYFGPKRSTYEFVNPDGTINLKEAMQFQREHADMWGGFRMENRAENPLWHETDPNTFLHTKEAAQYAWNMPLPEGVSRRDLMLSTLGHDFGKMFTGDGHGQVGANYLSQIFPDLTRTQRLAISEHMFPAGEQSSLLGLAVKRADINTGAMSPEEVRAFGALTP